MTRIDPSRGPSLALLASDSSAGRAIPDATPSRDEVPVVGEHSADHLFEDAPGRLAPDVDVRVHGHVRSSSRDACDGAPAACRDARGLITVMTPPSGNGRAGVRAIADRVFQRAGGPSSPGCGRQLADCGKVRRRGKHMPTSSGTCGPSAGGVSDPRDQASGSGGEPEEGGRSRPRLPRCRLALATDGRHKAPPAATLR